MSTKEPTIKTIRIKTFVALVCGFISMMLGSVLFGVAGLIVAISARKNLKAFLPKPGESIQHELTKYVKLTLSAIAICIIAIVFDISIIFLYWDQIMETYSQIQSQLGLGSAINNPTVTQMPTTTWG